MKVRSCLAALTVPVALTTGCHHDARGPLQPDQVSNKAACRLLTHARALSVLGSRAKQVPLDEPDANRCDYKLGSKFPITVFSLSLNDSARLEAGTWCRGATRSTPVPQTTIKPVSSVAPGADECVVTTGRGRPTSVAISWTAGDVSYLLLDYVVGGTLPSPPEAVLKVATEMAHD